MKYFLGYVYLVCVGGALVVAVHEHDFAAGCWAAQAGFWFINAQR